MFLLDLKSCGSPPVVAYPSPTTLCNREHKVIFRCYDYAICFISRQKSHSQYLSYNIERVRVLNLSFSATSLETIYSGAKGMLHQWHKVLCTMRMLNTMGVANLSGISRGKLMLLLSGCRYVADESIREQAQALVLDHPRFLPLTSLPGSAWGSSNSHSATPATEGAGPALYRCNSVCTWPLFI